MLLSYDVQKLFKYRPLSIREDLLMEDFSEVYPEPSMLIDKEIIHIGIDTEMIRERILKLMEEGIICPMNGSVLRDMLYEELESYFNGTKTAEEVATTLQNRV